MINVTIKITIHQTAVFKWDKNNVLWELRENVNSEDLILNFRLDFGDGPIQLAVS